MFKKLEELKNSRVVKYSDIKMFQKLNIFSMKRWVHFKYTKTYTEAFKIHLPYKFDVFVIHGYECARLFVRKMDVLDDIDIFGYNNNDLEYRVFVLPEISYNKNCSEIMDNELIKKILDSYADKCFDKKNGKGESLKFKNKEAA